jgi:hypothetical protein
MGPNPTVKKLLHSAKTIISSSHRQLSTIIIMIHSSDWGTWVAAEKLRNSSMNLLFDYQSISYYISTILHFLTTMCAQVRVDVSAKNFILMSYLSIWRWPPSLMYQQLHAFYSKPWISSRIESASSFQLVSSCGVGKLTIDLSSDGWRAVQIAILSWIVPVRPGARPARIAKWKVSYLIRIGLIIRSWCLSQLMA